MAMPQSPSHEGYGPVPFPSNPAHLDRGYGFSGESRPNSYLANSIVPSDFAVVQPTNPMNHSQSAYPSRFNEEIDMSQRGSFLTTDGASGGAGLQRSESQMSHNSATPSRGGTLKKKPSLGRKASLGRSGSRRSLRAGSVRSLNLGEKEKYVPEDGNSAFYVPIPTSGSPTEELANRFQAWRKLLKDLIVFFKEIQKSYETRAKLLLSAGNIINNTSLSPTFLESGGLGDAAEILRDYHKQGLAEANKAKEVENEVILQLTGLRSDLQQKTKEIKSLSGDFKNTVDKEVDGTRKAVRNLQESLGLVDVDPSASSGRHDPFILRLQVDKLVDKQIEEENYLHRAYLNLENSGRELESIVVGEIQKAYNAYASILKRESDVALDAVEKLRAGPISMPKDHEWNNFITNSEQLVDPRIPVRNVENITYPGKDHPAAAEVRSGMLERKSKYLKSYTPGWSVLPSSNLHLRDCFWLTSVCGFINRYVLSPTHLHEFKSADRIASQTPIMSLYLPEQKLGSHSQPGSSSHKFMLKGRQTGAMHRGHAWVFRAESYDTMMAWFNDIENLIEKTGEDRNAFVRRHIRSLSGNSFRASSISSDGVMDEDEADQTPYSSQSAVLQRASSVKGEPAQRPRPGGRFPSDVQIDRHLQATMSLSSGESSGAREVIVNTAALPGSDVPHTSDEHNQDMGDATVPSHGQLAYRPADGEYNEFYGTWSGTDQEPDHLSQQEQLYRQQPAASSQPPIATNSEAKNEHYADVDTLDPAQTSIYAAGGHILDEDISSTRRQESQRSRETYSTHSMTASIPTSEATSPLSENTAATTATRPTPKPKESESTLGLLKMPGDYPRPAAS
ncbi:hypothetical protein UA08_00637 [Talaromyces atroroseus]|uniref:Uncharacterized protein n=1 Tax=Talaromyces atroroseus TaxID=1441469 RepID=A0A225BCU7_TALAT|nr:hypothetical protein UA08_00637 [Talaromyces atroroseus]OKL63867.1 hypothetical protein UA08_00637 [Talaromyces atroroseus]